MSVWGDILLSRLQVSSLILVIAVAWGGLLILEGVTLTPSWFDPFSKVVGLMVIVLALFDRWLWRLGFLHPKIISTPVLIGTWKGKILSNWIDPKTGRQIPGIDAYLSIKQSYSTITMKLMTEESSSELISGSLQRKKDGTFTLTGIYCNTPGILNRDSSPMHRGALILDICDSDNLRLDGEYWTDRNTKGNITFEVRLGKPVNDYNSAKRLLSRD